MNKPLIINAPTQGIAPSPHLGYGDCRNLDIYSVPGVAKINFALAVRATAPTALPHWLIRNSAVSGGSYSLDSSGNLYIVANSGGITKVVGNVFTVSSASPAVFSCVAHGLLENDTIVLATTGALYTGLTAGTTYYVIAGGLTADAFEVSATEGGAAVNTSGSQSGVHTYLITTGATGNGLVIWKDYAFIARDTAMDVYGPISNIGDTPWTNNWQADATLIDSDALWHPMIVSRLDDKIYGGAGKYIFTIKELTTFVPATAASYTFTARALTSLPSTHRIKCLAEQGNNIMIGTWVGASAADFVRIADVFPWNGSDPNHGQPISIEEIGVHAMITKNSILYILAGIEGRVYSSNGVQTSLVAQIPDSVVDLMAGGAIYYYPGAIAIWKEKIVFGVGTSGGSGGCGVWSLQQTSMGNVLALEHLVHTGNAGETNPLYVGAILPSGYTHLRVGFRDHTTYGINDFTNRYTAYTAFFDSPLYQIGFPSNLEKFNQLELILAKELAVNEGIRVQYRINLTDSWTTIGTYDFATYGAIYHYDTKIDAISVAETDTIQVRVLLTGTTTTPQFKQVILR